MADETSNNPAYAHDHTGSSTPTFLGGAFWGALAGLGMGIVVTVGLVLFGVFAAHAAIPAIPAFLAIEAVSALAMGLFEGNNAVKRHNQSPKEHISDRVGKIFRSHHDRGTPATVPYVRGSYQQPKFIEQLDREDSHVARELSRRQDREQREQDRREDREFYGDHHHHDWHHGR